ncbi:MAG: hypothetical protein NZM13_03605, partial [Cyclobacteriaceae bacterium]|nr:hypothetical protein [Cyclobacteriaceae bacterium]
NYLLLPNLLRRIKRSKFKIISYYTSHLVLPLRAHYLFFEDKTPPLLRWLGFRTYLTLKKE